MLGITKTMTYSTTYLAEHLLILSQLFHAEDLFLRGLHEFVNGSLGLDAEDLLARRVANGTRAIGNDLISVPLRSVHL